jgi:uncharacterized spore protein YtfJ
MGKKKPRKADALDEVPASTFSSLRRALDQIEGARLCYGEPVEMHGRTIVPVARVRAAGGLGFGRGWGTKPDGEDGGGGGGGGAGQVDATPVGFLTIGPEGAHFESIPDPEAPARAVKLLASAAATLVTALAGARALRGATALPGSRRRAVTGLLRRGG